jgi:thioredoxin reductase (NADPH)
MESRADARVTVIGFQWSPVSHDVKDFLARNRVPYDWVDAESSPRAAPLLERLGVSMHDLPVVVFPDGGHVTSPSNEVLAERIGLRTEAASPFYDLVVVGGGPAGLAAAVYGASEGLRTVVVESEAPGGQAGLSAHIENYLGLRGGLSGAEFARLAVGQAHDFGVEVVAARAAVGLRAQDPYRFVRLDDGDELACRAVLIAVGVGWRTLEAPGCRGLVGRGIYYGAASAEAPTCTDEEVYLVGGGNSSGQAAMLLSRYARSVTLVAPEPDFGEKMSRYLLERLEERGNVCFLAGRTVVGARGDEHLEEITLEDVETGEREIHPTTALFVFIGARPRTDWLEDALARDEDGYLLAGSDARTPDWPLERDPYPLETRLPGVFVAGDVRAGSVKRIGAAVGEGSSAIQYIHSYLAEG